MNVKDIKKVNKEMGVCLDILLAEMDGLRTLLRRVDAWRGPDGDGITDPLRENIKKTLGEER